MHARATAGPSSGLPSDGLLSVGAGATAIALPSHGYIGTANRITGVAGELATSAGGYVGSSSPGTTAASFSKKVSPWIRLSGVSSG